jgi:phosphoglycolate phosphatase-like HAD superfamily hydrolase
MSVHSQHAADPQAALRRFPKRHEYLVCVDSDGCAFDTMEIKHKQCFIPNIVRCWRLQAVSKFVRVVAEFVNLYSRDRGMNRFPALVKTFDLLNDWPEASERGTQIPRAQALRDWIGRETRLGNPALKAEVARTGDPVLMQALEWSEAVNRTIAEIVQGAPPFPFVRESLETISVRADVLVCSATPHEALVREWEEHGLARFADAIAGQEVGGKTAQIALASGGRYDPANVIMIGDAPGDLEAARANRVRFFPIDPGAEAASWESFFREVAGLFLEGDYTAACEAERVRSFERLLPEIPWWKAQPPQGVPAPSI